ncbi:MAG: transporter substrate-binding domain-containing protein, partial [Leptospiraceae bacterium]|nr:transporter substrate-binding domain-containing protein [Leptospiraceae bacterium]
MSTAFRLLLCVLISAPMSGLLARDLQIGVYGSPPFVITDDAAPNSRLRGVSIELWQEIARRRQFQYQFHPVASIPEGMEQLRAGQLDVLVGSLSVTRERTTRVDFTHPYYSAFQGILSRQAGFSLLRLARKFLSGGLPIALGVLLLLLFLVGAVIWKLERDINPHMPGTFGRGVGTGMWFAMVTFVTVGYGDVTPRSP